MAIYSGTAISAIENRALTQEFYPTEEFKRALKTQGRSLREITICTVLVGVHTTQYGSQRTRIENPDTVDPANYHTYFVEVAMALTDILKVKDDYGDRRIGYAQIVSGYRPTAEMVFFNPGRKTTRLIFLAEGIRPKTRDGKVIRLWQGEGEILNEFLSPQFNGTYMPASENTKCLHPELSKVLS